LKVCIFFCGKVFGADVGPFKTPAREDDRRLMPPNFHFDLEYFLRERHQGKASDWPGTQPPKLQILQIRFSVCLMRKHQSALMIPSVKDQNSRR